MTESEGEFEAFLKTRTVLPKGMSDDDKLEPPQALDAIVLKKARAAIHARERVNRAPRWATPVALAATILLCLSIVLNVSLNTNRPAASLQRMTAATADRPSSAPAAPASEDERRGKVADGTISHDVILPEEKVAEFRAPRPPVLADAAPAAPAEAAPAAPAEPPRAHGSAARKAQALARRSGTSGNPAPTEATGPSATGPAGVAAAPERDQPALAKRKAAASPHPQDPKTWLQQIAALRAEGKAAQADAEMQRFRDIFPAYPAKPGPSAPSEPPK
jgi:hypothetical protein